MDKILVTGASGFIGSFIVEEALRQGMEVWAAMRKSSSKAFLTDPRIRFIYLDLQDPSQLTEQLKDHRFDYVVHAAGVTKCIRKDDFYRVNTEGTRHLAEALLQLQMPLKKMVYLSSLSIFGPIREQQPYTEILETDTPQPNTAYGDSKVKAEQFRGDPHRQSGRVFPACLGDHQGNGLYRRRGYQAFRRTFGELRHQKADDFLP